MQKEITVKIFKDKGLPTASGYIVAQDELTAELAAKGVDQKALDTLRQAGELTDARKGWVILKKKSLK